MQSMTGFGVGRAVLPGGGELSVEARSVNHKYLDLRLTVPEALSGFSLFVEQRARKRITRGRFDLRLRLEGGAAEATLDLDRARVALQALGQLRDELAPGEPLPLSLLSAVPDLFGAPSLPREATESALGQALDAALSELEAMRRREGEALADELRRHLEALRGRVDEVAGLSKDLSIHHRDRLRERVSALLADTEVALDEGRLEHEIALLAERSDITEELARLDSHLVQATAMLKADGPVGRKLDFLFQEMTREVNTIGSKSPDADIAQRVVNLKADVDRLRQQVANVA